MLLFQIWLWGIMLLCIPVMGYFVKLQNNPDLTVFRDHKSTFIVITGMIFLWPLVLLAILILIMASVGVKTD